MLWLTDILLCTYVCVCMHICDGGGLIAKPCLTHNPKVAHQAPLSMRFLRQEYWSGLLFPSPGDLPDPGIEPVSPALQADSSTYWVTSEAHVCVCVYVYTHICIYTSLSIHPLMEYVFKNLVSKNTAYLKLIIFVSKINLNFYN